jgi:hypothetical protein
MITYSGIIMMFIKYLEGILGDWAPVFFWSAFLGVWALTIYVCWSEKEVESDGIQNEAHNSPP